MFKAALMILLVVLGTAQSQRTSSVTGLLKPLVELIRSNRDGPNQDGSYSFSFETSDGIKRNEQGQLTAPQTFAITGSYSYVAPDGTLVEVTYIADENGYRAESPLIPTAGRPEPPIRPVISKFAAAPPRNIK